MCLWVELDRSLDTLRLFDRARQENIPILPGALFSATGRYNHCLRLNCGYPMNDAAEQGIVAIGRLNRETGGE